MGGNKRLGTRIQDFISLVLVAVLKISFNLVLGSLINVYTKLGLLVFVHIYFTVGNVRPHGCDSGLDLS